MHYGNGFGSAGITTAVAGIQCNRVGARLGVHMHQRVKAFGAGEDGRAITKIPYKAVGTRGIVDEPNGVLHTTKEFIAIHCHVEPDAVGVDYNGKSGRVGAAIVAGKELNKESIEHPCGKCMRQAWRIAGNAW